MHNHEEMEKKGARTMAFPNKMLLICGGLLAVAIIAVTVLKVSVGSLLYIGLFLMCPLMHIMMMGGGGHKHK
jgi:hypothetical protein